MQKQQFPTCNLCGNSKWSQKCYYCWNDPRLVKYYMRSVTLKKTSRKI